MGTVFSLDEFGYPDTVFHQPVPTRDTIKGMIRKLAIDHAAREQVREYRGSGKIPKHGSGRNLNKVFGRKTVPIQHPRQSERLRGGTNDRMSSKAQKPGAALCSAQRNHISSNI